MSERIKVLVDDSEIDAAVAKIDAALARAAALPQITTRKRAVSGELSLQELGAYTWMLQLIDEKKVDISKIKGDLEETESMLGEIDFPQVDRATRMILLRLPALRETLRGLYIVKMLERTLRLGDVRGPVTAILVVGLYAWMAVQTIQRWINQREARDRALEAEMDQRYITLEEALRRFGVREERYIGNMPP